MIYTLQIDASYYRPAQITLHAQEVKIGKWIETITRPDTNT